MAAPTFVTASAGTTDAGGAWSHTSAAPSAAGNLLILHVLQDGTGADNPTIGSPTNVEALDGTANTMNKETVGNVGLPLTGRAHVWIGRATSTSAMVVTGGNAGTDDLYIMCYEFTNVTAQSGALDAVREAWSNEANTSGTISDTGVTTVGIDRLAINLVSITDDNTITVFTGMTGGTWSLDAQYVTATGTDGAISLMTAAMPSVGTINGGTTTNPDAADGFGVMGFALIGNTPGTPPRHPATDHALAFI